jgi:hypothetical protein
MAGHATFGLDRLMLEDERSLLIRVAGVADFVACCCGAELLADKSTVRIVAIGTLDESFFHPVVKGHVELWLDLLMAAVTEGRLSLGQKELISRRVMGRVAAQTA